MNCLVPKCPRNSKMGKKIYPPVITSSPEEAMLELTETITDESDSTSDMSCGAGAVLGELLFNGCIV